MRDIKFGKTQNIVIKLGKKSLMCDFDKFVDGAVVNVYDKSSAKKDQKYCTVEVKADAILTKDFFENINEIVQSQKLLTKYQSILLR